jgi:hypothetical protein
MQGDRDVASSHNNLFLENVDLEKAAEFFQPLFHARKSYQSVTQKTPGHLVTFCPLTPLKVARRIFKLNRISMKIH